MQMQKEGGLLFRGPNLYKLAESKNHVADYSFFEFGSFQIHSRLRIPESWQLWFLPALPGKFQHNSFQQSMT